MSFMNPAATSFLLIVCLCFSISVSASLLEVKFSSYLQPTENLVRDGYHLSTRAGHRFRCRMIPETNTLPDVRTQIESLFQTCVQHVNTTSSVGVEVCISRHINRYKTIDSGKRQTSTSLGTYHPVDNAFLFFPVDGPDKQWMEREGVSEAVDAMVRLRIPLLELPWSGHVFAENYTNGAVCDTKHGTRVHFHSRVLFACDPTLTFPVLSHLEYGDCNATMVVSSREACELPQSISTVKCSPTYEKHEPIGRSLQNYLQHGGSLLLSAADISMRGHRPKSPDPHLTQFDAGLAQRKDVELTVVALTKAAFVRRDSAAIRELVRIGQNQQLLDPLMLAYSRSLADSIEEHSVLSATLHAAKLTGDIRILNSIVMHHACLGVDNVRPQSVSTNHEQSCPALPYPKPTAPPAVNLVTLSEAYDDELYSLAEDNWECISEAAYRALDAAVRYRDAISAEEIRAVLPDLESEGLVSLKTEAVHRLLELEQQHAADVILHALESPPVVVTPASPAQPSPPPSPSAASIPAQPTAPNVHPANSVDMGSINAQPFLSTHNQHPAAAVQSSTVEEIIPVSAPPSALSKLGSKAWSGKSREDETQLIRWLVQNITSNNIESVREMFPQCISIGSRCAAPVIQAMTKKLRDDALPLQSISPNLSQDDIIALSSRADGILQWLYLLDDESTAGTSEFIHPDGQVFTLLNQVRTNVNTAKQILSQFQMQRLLQ